MLEVVRTKAFATWLQAIGGAKGTQKRDIKRALEMMKQLEG
jgi:putative component of toxin-antitoxin plasmid stabilization module